MAKIAKIHDDIANIQNLVKRKKAVTLHRQKNS